MRRPSGLFALVLSTIAASSLEAQGPMRVAPSGRASAEVVLTFADSAARAAAEPSKITIDYGQPHLRGRRIHTDSLVPYDKPWRTGANTATTLTTDVDLVLGGQSVPKGKYVLETLPSRAGWKLLLLKQASSPDQPAQPDAGNEVARIDLRRTELAVPLESLTMWLIPSREAGNPRGELIIAWANVSLSTDWAMK